MTSTETDLRALLAGEAHVWLSFSQSGLADEKVVRQMLSDQERERARKFRSTADCAEFVQAHALLRAVLSRYHPLDPGAWQFGRGLQGKPFIAAPAIAPPLQFNLSHTRGLAACVVTLNLAAGVDVERLAPHADLPDVAREFLPPTAVQELEKLSGGQQMLRFYEHWTRLEACGKARGVGVISRDSLNENIEDWRMFQQHILPDHLLAAVVRGQPGKATVFRVRTVGWQLRANECLLVPCEPEQTASVGPVVTTGN